MKYRLTKSRLDSAEVEAVEKVFASGWLAEGIVTEAFERRVADYVGAKYAVAVSNCTVALELCLMACDLDSDVLIPDFTHMGTIQAVINAQAIPILEDVDLNSYNMSTTDPMYYAARIPVSWGGNPNYCVAGVPPPIWIEDAACSLGSQVKDIKTGSAVTTCFSFHPRKLITTGEGGMVTTNNEELVNRIRYLKNFGDGGGNYKFDDVRAAIGLAQMDKLEGIIERRIQMAKVYDDLLHTSQDIVPPQKLDGVRHTYQTYAVRLLKGNRDEIINKLEEKSIETKRGAYALHLMHQYQNVKRIGDLHNSEVLDKTLLALPMAYDLSEEDQKFVVAELAKACNN